MRDPKIGKWNTKPGFVGAIFRGPGITVINSCTFAVNDGPLWTPWAKPIGVVGSSWHSQCLSPQCVASTPRQGRKWGHWMDIVLSHVGLTQHHVLYPMTYHYWRFIVLGESHISPCWDQGISRGNVKKTLPYIWKYQPHGPLVSCINSHNLLKLLQMHLQLDSSWNRTISPEGEISRCADCLRGSLMQVWSQIDARCQRMIDSSHQ